METRYLLGIDIGGTAIKAGLFSTSGVLVGEASVRTPALVTPEAFDVVTKGLYGLIRQQGVDVDAVLGIGLDIPGPVDENGDVALLPNLELDLPGLQEALAKSFPTARLVVLNDANAAAFGELWQGSAQGERSFVFVTLGTGVGGGVVVDGELVLGRHGAGGELGHIHVRDGEERSCGCGLHGCLEQYASATGLVRLYQEECERESQKPFPIEHSSDSLSVFRALATGDKCAAAAIDQMCDYLATAFAAISCVVDPGAFVIGGGMAGSLPVFVRELERCYQARAFKACTTTRIVAAGLGNKAGIYGAAYQALVAVRSA